MLEEIRDAREKKLVNMRIKNRYLIVLGFLFFILIAIYIPGIANLREIFNFYPKAIKESKWLLNEQYEYRRADGSLSKKGLEAGLRLIPPSNCNCTYKFINFEMKNDSIQFEMKDSTINSFKITDVIYVRDVNYSDSQMIEFVLSANKKNNRLTNELYYYSDIDKYKELISKKDYKRLQKQIKLKEYAREEKKETR